MNLALALAALLAQGATPAPAPLAPQGNAHPAEPRGAAAGASPAQDAFEQRCKFCHGTDGRGRTRKGKELKAPDFTSARWIKGTADEEIFDAIKNGVPKTKMPAFRNKLSDDEIQALAVYVRTFGDRGQK